MGVKHYDVIVIGGGPGGYTAALYCARSGRSVAVLEKLSAGGQMATTDRIDNYPGFEEGIDGFELGERMERQAWRFGVSTVYGEVRSVELAGRPKRIESTEGSFEAEAVILATGAFPRELGLPDEQALRGRGVAYCAACDGMLYRGKTVVASAVSRDALRENGVEILWNSRITALRKEKRLTGVEVEDLRTGARRELFCDGLFVAIGRVPDTALFAGQVELDPSGYIVADETTRTSVPGVFAVGDARTKAVRQIVTAVADGAVAAHYAEEFLLEDAVKDKNLS